MRNGQRVIDADGHAVEPYDLWDRYLDRAFWDVRPRLEPPPVTEVHVLGLKMPRRPQWALQANREQHRDAIKQPLLDPRYAKAAARGFDAPSYVETMDEIGIDQMVMYPTRGLYACSVDGLSGPAAAAIARAYNRWLADFCADAPGRILGAALIPMHDPELAAAEAEFAVKELELTALMVRPNPIRGRNLCDASNDVFFDTVEALDVPIGMHEGTGGWVESFGTRFLDEPVVGAVAWHACCHPMEQMAAVLNFTLGGILERHPALKVAFLESGSAWLPYWLARLDEHAETAEERALGAGNEYPLTLTPSQYFARNCWIAMEPDDPMLGAVIAAIGRDRFLWATDYPHPECDPTTVVDDLFDCPALGADDLQAIACDNPSAFYGFELTPRSG